jgi:hypothetical protein
MDNETYLGDGLYARFDGFSIWLRAPRENGDHVIALEPGVLAALIDYAEQVGMRRRPVKPSLAGLVERVAVCILAPGRGCSGHGVGRDAAHDPSAIGGARKGVAAGRGAFLWAGCLSHAAPCCAPPPGWVNPGRGVGKRSTADLVTDS